MIIALTGTPGTGKTKIATILWNKYNIKTIHLYNYAKNKGLIEGYDKQRKSDIIDMGRLNQSLYNLLTNESLVVLDGHISHLLTFVNNVIVLRCHPLILETRLLQKKWSKEKIRENIQAEILDIIETEAVDVHSVDKVIEIDTSDKSSNENADLIHTVISSGFKDIDGLLPGTVDWTEILMKDEFDWEGDLNGP